MVGTTDFENRLKKCKKCCEALKTAYQKLKNFWLASRSPIALEIIQRVCNRNFPHPNLTRWNSKFDSISVAEKHRHKINEAIDKVNREANKNARNKNAKRLEMITMAEWKVLKDYCSCLQPIAIALDILQGEKRSCQGYILPTLYGIKASLEDQLKNNIYLSEYGKILNKCAMDSIDFRFGTMMEIGDENRDLILAAAIHPNFKLSWLDNETDREYVQNLLINSYVELANSKKETTPENSVTEASSTTEDETIENQFFKRIRSAERRTSSDDTTTLDIWKYLLQPVDDPNLIQVRAQPLIEELFRKHNTTLASSAAVERIFSRALIIFTPRRNRISDENFEKILFIHVNRELISDGHH